MKTIEERIHALLKKHDNWTIMVRSVLVAAFREGLTELAADLNAEKEKEVAEFRAELDSYKKRVETLAMRIVDRDFKMANETLPAVDVVDLLDEVKRVLGAVAGCKLFYEDSADIDNYTTDDVNNLLTRLGPFNPSRRLP